MRKQDYLIGLIRSMDANEKRYFKLFTSLQSGPKQFIDLFECLENKDRYNATELCVELNFTPSKLADLKRYLSQVLLKSIRIYKDEAKSEAAIYNGIAEVQELVDRNLLDFALEIVDKVIDIAKKEQSQIYLTKLMWQKTVILFRTGRYQESYELCTDIKTALRNEIQTQDILQLNIAMTEFEQSRKKPEEFAHQDHRALKLKPEDIPTRRGQNLWFSIMSRYYMIINKDPLSQLQIDRLHLTFFEKDGKPDEQNPLGYLTALIKVVVAEAQSQNLEAALLLIEKFQNHLLHFGPKKVGAEYRDMNLFAGYQKAALLLNLGRYEEGVAVGKTNYESGGEIDNYIKYTALFDYAKSLLHNGQASAAIGKLDELLLINTEWRRDIQLFMRPCMMLAYLDMKNYGIIPPFVRTTRAWMKRKKIDQAEVNSFLSFAHAIAKAPELKRKEEWKKLEAYAQADHLPSLDKELHLKRWLRRKAVTGSS